MHRNNAVVGSPNPNAKISNYVEQRQIHGHNVHWRGLPPCTKPLSKLTPISIHELKLETQHRGRVLVVKTFCQPNRMSSIQNAVEDENNHIDRLAIYNVPPSSSAETVLPCDALFAIKEPYYKLSADGGVLIRVDHPSDLVPLQPHHYLVPSNLKPRVTGLETKSIQLKEEGNIAFKREYWQKAVECYTTALNADVQDDVDLQLTLYRNRAAALLEMGRYELAVDDALASLVPGSGLSKQTKTLNVKALGRAGKASYALGEYSQAAGYFERVLELDASYMSIKFELERTRKRLTEQEAGAFDFTAMSKSATKSHTKLDHASFLKNAKVSPAGSYGRGLFATKALKPGDIIFVEKAFFAVFRENNGQSFPVLINISTNRISMGNHANLLYGVIDKMQWNSKQANRCMDLFDGDSFNSTPEAAVLDGMVVVNTFRVQAIIEYNCFGCPQVKSSEDHIIHEKARQKDSTGMWLHAAHANHSCIPNASRSFIGDMMIVRANKTIKAGNQIFMGYQQATMSYVERAKKLRDGYRFDCHCELCTSEAKVSISITQNRTRFCAEADNFVSQNTLSRLRRTMSIAKINQAKKLQTQIQETYEELLFKRLPRLSCVALDFWLCQASGGRSVKEAIDTALLLLRDAGYFVSLKECSGLDIDRTHAVPMLEAIHAAMHASQAYEAMGKFTIAAALEDLAKEIYIVLYSELGRFDEKFKQDSHTG